MGAPRLHRAPGEPVLPRGDQLRLPADDRRDTIWCGIAELFSYHPGSGDLVNYGAIYDAQQRVGADQIHDIAITADGTIYAGENDVPHRSSDLWEIQGAIPS